MWIVERWRHIVRCHPELSAWRRSVLAAIRSPTESNPDARRTSAGTVPLVQARVCGPRW